VSRSVSSASVSGSTVVLTLASAVGAGQSVTVAYADPTAGNDASAVQDSAGNDAASLSATAVTNNVPAADPGPDPGTTTTTVAPATTSTTTTTTTVAPVATTSTTTTTTVAPVATTSNRAKSKNNDDGSRSGGYLNLLIDDYYVVDVNHNSPNPSDNYINHELNYDTCGYCQYARADYDHNSDDLGALGFCNAGRHNHHNNTGDCSS